jgi:ketosteroid isomerase-like protein
VGLRPGRDQGRRHLTADDVLAANQAFYDAHEQRDIEAMRALWEHSERVVCIHPGWPILRTWPVVEASWERILGGPGRNQFIVTNTSVTVMPAGDTDSVAWVTLDENLVEGQVAGTIAATNVFVRNDGRWLLVHHHGSPVLGR